MRVNSYLMYNRASYSFNQNQPKYFGVFILWYLLGGIFIMQRFYIELADWWILWDLQFFQGVWAFLFILIVIKIIPTNA